MQTSMLIGFFVVSTLWVATTLVWPAFAQHISKFDGTFLTPTIGVSVLTTFWIKRMFDGYSNTPHVADRYRAPAVRRMTRLLFIVIPVLWTILVGITLRLLTNT
jgi:hypothetical protein